MEDTHVHALDYLSVFRRRKWWLIAPILTSIVVGLVLLQLLPKEYHSKATLGVSAASVSPNLVNQTTALDNQERIRAISQQLINGTILARVAKEEGLLAEGSAEADIARLRRSVSIAVPEPVAATNEPRRLDTFVITYADEDPSRAQRIANRLVSVFVDENSKARTENAESTSAFLAAQLRASETRLNELEAAVRSAKESHMGQLPEQTQANLQTLSGLRQQMEANATALRGEQDRLSMIERQLDALKQGSGDVLIVPRGGDSMQAQSPDTRVLLLQRELAAARMMYTDKHPEVQRLEEDLAAARKEAAAERQRPSEDRLAHLQLDPAYRQLVGDREMARLRIRDLQRADVDTRRQIAVYQARVESAPRVEQQLTAVQRDYELEKQQYSELSSKLHTASIAENVERTRRGEQFTVLYPASFPTEPAKPIPWRVMLIAIMGGICLGGAATFAREYLDRSVHDVRDIKDEFEVPVLGEVTRIQVA
jgi:polysaccharide chain length determinant protein (PEP-CTERM system associated)